ncbi:MAG: AbrB family transcriptional regulator [Eubacteriales bacterium]|nr:AbrB family transcriptional regulator [Eubacteriales bacterium]
MEDILSIAGTLALAYAAGFVAKKCKLPAGALLGAMLCVTAFNVVTGWGYLPVAFRSVMQICSGALLGHTIGKSDVLRLKNMWKPAGFLIAGLIVLNVSLGLALHKLCRLNLATALFAAAPGGVSDMALIADELGADSATVSLLQLARLFAIILVYPPVFRAIAKKAPAQAPEASVQAHDNPAPRGQWFSSPAQARNFLWTALCSIAGGIVCIFLQIPAGGMVGSMLASAAFNLKTERAYVPPGLRFWIQASAGAFLGARMDADSFRRLSTLLPPVLVLVATVFLFTALLGYLMHRATRMDLPSSLMSISPGGIQEMSLMADDLGCNTTNVLILQTVRLIAVVCIFPSILKWIILL